jgi:4-hydroxy-tetrahydrodipicolinate synthase
VSIAGVQNITVPSFDRTLRRLDPAGIAWDVEHALAQGFSATLLALNAGLSPAEMRQFVEIAVDAADSRLQIGIEMPAASFELARELLEFAGGAGATHALLTVPQGFLPADEAEVYAAYAPLLEVAQSMRLVLPIGAVGFPPELGGGVPWETWARLAGEPCVAAVHVTTWLPQVLFAALKLFSARLEVGIGTPLLLGALPLLHREYGVEWLSPAHWELWQSPEQPNVVRYLELVRASRKQEALDIHWRLGPARGIAFGAGLLDLELDGLPHYSMAKYVSWTVGGNGGVTREPALHVAAHQLQARQAMLRAVGIEPRAGEAEFLLGRSAAGAPG